MSSGVDIEDDELEARELNISIDRNSEEPIYRQLIRMIRLQIESGALAPGQRLPASRDLADQLGISRISVVNAYAELRSENYLSAHPGRGTFVSREGSPITRRFTMGSQSAVHRPVVIDYSIRDMMRLAQKPGVINFSHGALSPEFYPEKVLRDAINKVLDRDGAQALSYEVPEGYAPLRIAVRDYVSALGIQCKMDQVLITGGAQQGIDLIVQSLLCEGDTLVSANPTYLGILDIARMRRAQIHGIEMDDEGIRLDMLENFLIDNTPKLIYVMPNFQNPTGQVLPLHRRRQLLSLASDYNVTVLEDAVFHEFRFEGEVLPPLKALDETDNVIHVSAFTKLMFPGMRIGYLITNRYYERLVRVKQAADISTSGLNQRAIHLLLEQGVFMPQMERNNHELRRRRDVALKAAERYFPPGTNWNRPQGGVYLWVELPSDGPTAAELFIAAIQMKVAFAVGSMFYTDGGDSHHIRINYGLQPKGKIEEGFRRLGQAWQNLTQDYKNVEKSPVL